ncbi:hypothetical protein KOM00_09260 [Geomonas sp. Red69]|uniref:hypothetical protein n=1 Tax=Geomonas diazotrophica TaxID=2843197 RepID=UPI001C125D39|nr:MULTISPECIES: hypothetical protein [Geomonas]MBU5636922.1 hypothetical protein [Geomonas diazotrophica]QXE87971.1 hypothetical protein KP003_06100 [Geomonas nitrogeniifigens]
MEIFGGFMMMMSIIGFFLVVIWFILPFVIFNIKGRVDRSAAMLEEMDQRLKNIERILQDYRNVEEQRPLDPPL